MYRLLLVDDEPLVLVGLKSMLQSEKYGVEICGTARNGAQALELILQEKPDIVITDIKMPIKTGLELIEECREHKELGALPVFIMLTSYEEFGFAKEAMRYGAVDYLVKIELSEQSLAAAIERAKERLAEVEPNKKADSDGGAHGEIQAFKDRFFVRLYNGLFENREVFEHFCSELGLEFTSPYYTVAFCSMYDSGTQKLSGEKQFTLLTSTAQVVKDSVEKYIPCTVTPLDAKHFSVLLCLERESDDEKIRTALENAAQNAYKYFNVRLGFGVGRPTADVYKLKNAYKGARAAVRHANAARAAVFEAEGAEPAEAETFNIADYREPLSRAFSELEADALRATIEKIVHSFDSCEQNSELTVQAMDAASTLLYMAISFMPDGENCVNAIFADEADGYRCLYGCRTVESCCAWIEKLSAGLCEAMPLRRQGYKERLVSSVKEYISANLGQKLSLNDVAAVFGFTPNYLSQLFAQYSSVGFVEYITDARINAAKTMLLDSDKKVYEIAEALGFESAFYFSKVFKKLTGLSPREFIQSRKA